jgi:hypothetical protein
MYILGGIDLISSLVLLFGKQLNLPATFFMFFAFLLFAKCLMGMLKDFASWIDLICGILLLLSIPLILPFAVKIVASAFLIQKGLFSFIEL